MIKDLYYYTAVLGLTPVPGSAFFVCDHQLFDRIVENIWPESLIRLLFTVSTFIRLFHDRSIMKKSLYRTLIIGMACLFLTRAYCSAGQPLKVAFGDSLRPWVIPENSSGILVDMIKETLEPSGYSIIPVFVPYHRRITAYVQEKVDATCDINPKIMTETGLEGFLSVTAYAYENIGVSLKKNGFYFSKISDLKKHRILAWQGAKETIGKEYAEMADDNPNYRELANQETQIKMLYSGREDLIQLDSQIFYFHRKKVAREGKIDTSQPIDIFPLFGKNDCGFLFRDEKAQLAFDHNLRQLKESGRYQAIFKKYID